MFAWENYLYACGPGNGPRNNRFAVFETGTGQVVDVTRGRRAPIDPPTPGVSLLTDPRTEDPLDFMPDN